MPIALNEIRARATAFAREYRDATSENADAQNFWRDFLHCFGVTARRVGAFERPVRDLVTASRRGRIDFLWKGKLLVEHKSRGEDLDAAGRQARDYFPGLRDEDLPRWIITSDFARIRLRDLETATEREITLRDLPANLSLFDFISGYTARPAPPANPVDRQAVQAMGTLHDLLEESRFGGRDLDVWMVRTLFCLFADTAGIFETGLFRDLVATHAREDGDDLGALLDRLFAVLDTPEDRRPPALAAHLAAFPYVNGALFGEKAARPETTAAMRHALLDACKVDWSQVSPAIFGSLFQTIKDRAERRAGGEHYTTEANILKCLDPLIMDALRADLAAATTRARQDALLARLRRIRIFDPACGCGNFLVVAYRELRRIELEVLNRIYGGAAAGRVASLTVGAVNVDQMFGIELEDWPAQIARVALWMTDHLMNLEHSRVFGSLLTRIPLRTAPRILSGVNALHEDWNAFCPAGPDTACVGNPPFVGAKYMNAAQQADRVMVFGGARNAGLLDYVTCWHMKAARWMKEDDRAECCFVSTNSITQGEQPAVLWAELWKLGVVLNFAHRTFQWTSEARGKAAVHCAILGFALKDRPRKRLWDYENGRGAPREVEGVRAINPYLVDGPMVALAKRTTPLCDVPPMSLGNQPIDGGHYLFTDEEKKAFLEDEPGARPFVRQWIGAEEFLNGNRRWCLYLADAAPSELRALPKVRERIAAVKAFRAKSKRPATRELAETPTRYAHANQPTARYLVIPEVSSETRRFIPMDFEPPATVPSNLLKIVKDATAYHFGILTSTMHMAWTRGVCGRLESRYRYSAGIVFNNFPWPDPTPAQRAAVEAAAAGVLAARAAHPSATLADLYDPLSMPANLSAAHKALDRTVDAAYAAPRAGFPTEAARLAFLFARYAAASAPLDARPAPRRRR